VTEKRERKIVAIDGPAGSGKSTAARLAAEELGFLYLDTGAMYRAATWKAIRAGIDFGDREALARSAGGMDIRFRGGRVFVDGEDATEEIRTSDVTNSVYRLADVQGVRDAMVRQQRKLGANGGIVAEGRDIGTIVFPDAEVKIYLDASVSERALRRFRELEKKGVKTSLEEVEREIEERDRRDRSRKIAPLRAAEGAVVLDTTDMTIGEVVFAVVEIVSKRALSS
jgi:CMP/dCMP kinase